MKILVITPPLVQLNSPYPSGAYLSAFFKQNKMDSLWCDLNIELFYSIFSKEGLTKLFELSEEAALKKADEFDRRGEDFAAYNLRRYVSSKDCWIEWIDFITSILCDGKKNVSGREKEHQLLYSPFAPRGNRMDSYLASLEKEPTVDDVKFLCSYALADIADYITAVFDSGFSLVRYAESLTVDDSSFAEIERNLNSPVMEHFYKPVLENYLSNKIDHLIKEQTEKLLVCISVPFAGTFLPALFTADFLKKKYSSKLYICFGGGFINTELRQTEEKALGKYIDAISYDRGYGSYWRLLLEKEEYVHNLNNDTLHLYKLRRFIGTEKVIAPLWKDEEAQKFEEAATVNVVPDYSSIDFSRYPRVCDDANPMHRMWSDGAWIKAYLAHGCYWHRCAFCDTQLDYVCGYKAVDTENVYKGLVQTAGEKGVYGIHFVDEALPPAVLKKFAALNLKDKAPLYYWGNVRFEKAFTKDLTDFLSCGGLGSVSAGLEIATGEGLKIINKGTDIESIVSACCAFKESGILIHAYMIYGFWNDTPQSIINSMETLRQFFAAGLLDSAFWHKFVLTRNSQVYSEWKKGLHKELRPVEPKESRKSCFAGNNLHFAGEDKYSKFGPSLDAALDAWMHGQSLDKNVKKWFNFEVPQPTIPKNFIDSYIEKYERKKAAACAQKINFNSGNDYYWLGTMPVVSDKKVKWFFLQEEMSAPLNSHRTQVCSLLWGLRPSAAAEERQSVIDEIKKAPELLNYLQGFRGNGLVCI